jgi:hypothetical protein
MFFVSPRNTFETHLSLLEHVTTSTFLIAEEHEFPFMSRIYSQSPLRRSTIPSLEDLLNIEPINTDSMEASFEEVRLNHGGSFTVWDLAEGHNAAILVALGVRRKWEK